MRLYIRLLGFTLLNLANIKPIKILQKYDNKSNPIILVNAINLTTSDDIVNLLLALLKKKEE